ncbi:hypothetical protein IKF04_03995 [Candidatus Saccharibacteria bacterium]|nr:hypothetical protein [Candidatus Saccharibacteria bacterium]
MAEYTNRVEIEELPKGIQIDGIGDTLPEGGDDVNVPLMKNGEPYPAHVPPEDPEMLNNPYCPDTGTEDDDSCEDCDVEADWDDEEADWYDDEGEGSSDWDDEEAVESGSPRDRFSEFAGVSVALFDSLSSILSDKDLRKLSFGVNSGDLGAFFSIERK